MSQFAREPASWHLIRKAVFKKSLGRGIIIPLEKKKSIAQSWGWEGGRAGTASVATSKH